MGEALELLLAELCSEPCYRSTRTVNVCNRRPIPMQDWCAPCLARRVREEES